MEVAITSPDLADRAVVYISDDCMSDYDLEQTKLPRFNLNREEYGPQKRAIMEISPKCLSWEEVLLNFNTLR